MVWWCVFVSGHVQAIPGVKAHHHEDIQRIVSRSGAAVTQTTTAIFENLRSNADSADGQASTFRAHFNIFDGECPAPAAAASPLQRMAVV